MATIRELIAHLRKRAKELAEAVNTSCKALAQYLLPATSARVLVPAFLVSSESGNALDAGKQYRLTSGHAPIFSLFTCFGLR
ncbi:MAG: hypothetical protein NTW33_01930 [Methanoregula sp.]|nr:hypothetical protein [Methanoregula sp.]